ncbi:MAG: hypothetical protein JXN64_01110 [Spirochaetes bacterium]|nr:hypothetical protein [Spirochaetota bacterium]
MFIRKVKIASIIKKERGKERMLCKKENDRNIKQVRNEMNDIYKQAIREMKEEHKKIIEERNAEIRYLKNEIEKNYNVYTSIRLREKNLYDLYMEVESELARMMTKVHESMQPFYRTMSKIELTKKKSDKKHNKYDRVLSVAK